MRLRLETTKRIQKLAVKAGSSTPADKKARAESIKAGDQIFTRKAKAKPTTESDGVLSAPPNPPAKFRKRQLHKTWLPTHIFHSKRARMTPPKDPLWRFSIPLTPSEKSYRPTHRAARMRGAIAWDMSYMSTISLQGCAESIRATLQSLGVGSNGADQGLWDRKGQRWRQGKRTWQGWVYERESELRKPMAPVLVIWCAPRVHATKSSRAEADGEHPVKENRQDRQKLFIRVHPSAFLQLWDETLAIAKMQNPPVTVEDLRFEIGSIEVTGSEATEALLKVLNPVGPSDNEGAEADPSAAAWNALNGLTNAASLPLNACLTFSVSDPRLQLSRPIPNQDEQAQEERLLEVLAQWPPDQTQTSSAMFERNTRLAAGRQLPSQKSINRRKALAPPGTHLQLAGSDPRIPALLCASRPAKGGQGTWVLLLPWRCVLPFWYALMHCPLSSGGNVRFGGLREKRQVAFEAGEAWFPADHPGTKAGWDWEAKERQARKLEWAKRPRGKRIEWASVDLGAGQRGEIGLGWACDWERLVLGLPQAGTDTEGGELKSTTAGPPKQLPAKDPKKHAARGERTSSPPPQPLHPLPPPSLGLYNLSSSLASPILRRSPSNVPVQLREAMTSNALCSVMITLSACGSPGLCARIYRLPSKNEELRRRWLAVHASSSSRSLKKPQRLKNTCVVNSSKANTPESRRRALAASLLGLGTEKPSISSSSSSPRAADQRTGAAVPGFRNNNTATATTTTTTNTTNTTISMPVRAGDPDYPHVPDECDLVGFVTTGSFSLSEGQGVGIGCLLVRKMMMMMKMKNMTPRSAQDVDRGGANGAANGGPSGSGTNGAATGGPNRGPNRDPNGGPNGAANGGTSAIASEAEWRLCIVRNAGASVGRLATWELL